MTQNMSLDVERLHATIYLDDDEAKQLWLDAGFPDERISRHGDEDNWWGPAGSEGPCGPSSEIHYDLGADKGCLQSDCAPNCTNIMNEYDDECNRFVEIWNLVFMQFYHHLDGSRTKLPSTGVDTGMGFERLVRVMQNADTMYETDLFQPMISKAEEISGKKYGTDRATDYGLRTVAEHGRSVTFLIADGVVPGNEGRGYVLRRVIRRAIRYGKRIGLEGNFMGEIADVTIDKMGEIYPELVNNREFIITVLRLEEDRFQQAFVNGNAILMNAIEGEENLVGEIVFQLWDTHGFPVEMTQEIARENGVTVDMEGFEREMNAQRERARSTAQFGDDRAKIRVYESLGVGGTRFLGYEQLTASSIVVGLISDNETVDQVTEGQEIEIALVQTPFYPEGGGQIGDFGEIVGPDGRIEIHDTQLVMPDLIMHFGKVTQGTMSMGDSIDAYVDPIRREDTARNHTATHMLHAALRQVLGAHVRQAGSYVAPDRLRFDFTHVQAVTDDEMWQVQLLVNEKVRQNARILKDEDTYQSAIRRGALAFFGDKYGETVRLVEIANGDTFSFEVCGGTHVQLTGEVGAVYVLGESSIGAGMRRIEAISGRAAERLVWERFHREDRLAQTLSTTPQETEERVQSLVDELAELQRERESMERKLSLQSAAGLLDSAQEVNGVTVLATRATAANADSLREVGDWLRDKLGSGVIVLGSVINDRPILISMVTKDLLDRGLNASDIARGAAKVMGGGGGGRPDVAQAGGRDASKLDDALALVSSLVEESLS
jgi:alanyl-tRNA synthetase